MRMMSRTKMARTLSKAYQIHKAGDVAQAMEIYRRILDADPRQPIALHYAALGARQLSDDARAQGRPGLGSEGIRLMAAAIEAAGDPTQVPAAVWHNYGKLVHDAGDVATAKLYYEAALALDETLGESWTNLGMVYGELGNRMRAEACWHRALECPIPSPEARFNLSMLRLLKGDYAQGWAEYEHRWESITFLHNHGRPDLTAPRWDGSRVGTLYVHGEQGAGDIIQMARYLDDVRSRVGRVVLEVASPLVPLFRETWSALEIVTRGDPVPPHDAECPTMSLPYVMGTDAVEKVPEPAPFWLATGFTPTVSGRIGLCWKGSPTHTNDRLRSMPFDECAPLFTVPGVEWQSLQYGETPDGLRPLEAADFLDTARVIATCELVITVDTSIAHLAGSLGVPTWLLLPQFAEWRWLQDRTDSPWYPSITIYRQPAAGDWHSLIALVEADLRARNQ